MVEIGIERLIELEEAERKLLALETHGVEDWIWYADAMRYLREEDE